MAHGRLYGQRYSPRLARLDVVRIYIAIRPGCPTSHASMHQTHPTSQTSLVQSRPCGPLQLEPMHVPKPGPGRVIVRVAASTMNSLDHKILTYGILAQEWPWIGGNEYAGTVVSIGPAVENLVVGDRVVAIAVNFLEGQEVSGWQEYALLRADLCTKLPDYVPFEKACAVPTAFVGASIAIAIELGLKYPDPPPAPPKKSAASIWESAMAALGNGATFGWDLEEGTIQDGVWLPKPKAMAIQEAPLSPDAVAQKAEAERLKREEKERKAKARQENDERIRATLTKAFAEEIEKRRTQGPQPSARRVPGYGTHPRRNHFGLDSDPWNYARPGSWDTCDTHNEVTRPGWVDGGEYRRFEVIHQRHGAPGLGLTGLGLDLGPRFGRAGLISPGPVGLDYASTSGSTSASASMGRSGSDDSNTSASTSEAVEMSASYPDLPAPNVGLAARRGSEPSLRCPVSLSTWAGVGSAPGPGLVPNLRRSPLLPTQSTNLTTIRPRSSGSIRPKAHSPASSARGTTSPYRVPAKLNGRSRGRGSPPYRVREQSPLGHRTSSSLEIGSRIEPAWPDRHDPSAQLSINGATTISSGYPTLSAAFPNPSSEVVRPPELWSLSAGGGIPDTFFPPPLTRTETPVYVMDEPILIWGGATCAGRAALQLLKRAGYTNLYVVAAQERHSELAKIAPTNTMFFDYRNVNVVDEIRAAIGAQKLNKVLDTVSMPCTLEPISQLVTSGAKIATFLPVNTPMPDGVEVKPVMFGRCNDYTGKDSLSFNFGKETMWPLLGELLRKQEWVYPPIVHLSGGLHVCATNAIWLMSSREYAGKRLVFGVSST
ncbi:alcohol dehydrogenase, catalytic domain, GroES family protein [Rhizoctonia solani AG-3 Rhs1AP]|uniref:Alcohol dehydrogenase, catalytic domain, GroES family protein n=1 Tax=Rhizoctonia solani AG-3 Rhs1AP TaxID=1086054 RepID=X8JE05_9AGAM|nr:alcohol dehydrogenase, catalytic domain, GroES family protein [Rhizoctonia solani AG-3 Rhs1AP]